MRTPVFYSFNVALLVLALLIGCRTNPDADSNGTTTSQASGEAVEDTLRAFFDGVSDYDYERLQGLTTDDFVVIENGPVWTLDSLTAQMRSLEKQGVAISYELSDMQTTVEGQAAWITYQNDGAFAGENRKRTYDWTESAVFRKGEGGWKVALLHSTVNETTTSRGEE